MLAPRAKAGRWPGVASPACGIRSPTTAIQSGSDLRDPILNIRDEFRKLDVTVAIWSPFFSASSSAQVKTP
jgi:hypothetical protein